MSMLIHATITVTGEKDALASCEARLRRLLSSQFLKDEVAEHHGPTALCYDLKIEGGIPFPAFAQASQEFPGLEFTAEWVNVAAGEKGRATLVNGRVTDQASERVATLAGDGHPVHVEVAPEGRLALALTLIRASRDEWRGYAVTATRDSLVRLVRSPESDAVELYATDGSAEWAFAWRGALVAPALTREELRPPLAIEPAQFQELDRLARDFVAGWIWFAAEGREEVAVERSRYARYGYAVSAANVRTSRLHRMRADREEGARLVHSTLGQDDLWAKDLILATWARLDTA
ncbi:MAG TPA: hypothetical protein VLB72_15435 [Burkholderiales bacterium]|nr:hypothetical protein [Burkholderiales bacterium]